MKNPKIYFFLMLVAFLNSCACDPNKYGATAPNAWAEYMRISPLSAETKVSEGSFIADQVDELAVAYPNTFVSPHLNRVANWSRRLLLEYQNALGAAASAYNQVRADGEPLKDAGQLAGELSTPEDAGFLAKPVRGLIGRGIVDLVNQVSANRAYNEAGSAALSKFKQEYERLVLDEYWICTELCYPINPILANAAQRIRLNQP